jgi:lipopolysaccharide/colanic/teichoic acid biosynthesis glycosyltransferase
MRATTRSESVGAALDSARSIDSAPLVERLRRAYVGHALAGLLPGRRRWLPKRALDLVIALPLLIAALPVSLAISLRYWIRFHRRATITALCAGRSGRVFALRRYRTAPSDPVAGSQPQPGALSTLSVLWRVLTGEMSLIGPAPWTVAAFTGRPAYELARLYVAPGALRLRPVGRLRQLATTQAEADRLYVTHGSLVIDIEQLAAALRPSRRFLRMSPAPEPSPSSTSSQEGSDTP